MGKQVILLILSGFPGENINICWSPDGQTIAVGNKDDVVTFIDAKTHRSKAEEQFKFEVNEISWNNDNNMFFLTNGNGCINILRWEGSSLGDCHVVVLGTTVDGEMS